jgi:multiple sugar transport system permease protein
MTSTGRTNSPAARRRGAGARYLLGAICLALSAIMLAPLVVSISASLKTTEEASAIPPTYFTHHLSLDSYHRLWSYQAGLPTYLFNSGAAAAMTILFCLLLTIPAGYALARFPVPGKEFIFVFLLLSLIVPYQSLLTPIFFMFARLHLTNTLVGLAIVHTTIQIPFSVYIMRNSFEAIPARSRRPRSWTARRACRLSLIYACRRSGRRSSPSRYSRSSPPGTSFSAPSSS